jgi:Uma2 family endonuclease
MAASAHIPVGEYLRISYRPDCDYVDGELQVRNSGEQTHGLVQKMIAAIFTVNRRNWGMRAIPEQRVQVSATRYRIPDVCIVASSEPIFPILIAPPLLCVEVLSPEDRSQRIVTRVQEYQRMGVGHIWIIDPETREVWTMSEGGGPVALAASELTIAGTPVRTSIADIFEEIDNAPKA